MKRRRSSTSSTSSDQNKTKGSSIEAHQSKRKKTTTENNHSTSKSSSNISVRLQNADMLTKYRNKNAHIVIETPKTKSNYTMNEINDDDEIWLCEIPNSIDVNQLLGKSVKLGSKKTTIDKTQLECRAESCDHQNGIYANTVSVISQNDDAKLSVKNLKTAGRMTIHKKIEDDQRETIELSPTVRHECTIFPESLTIRHPLFGNHFKDKIKVDKRIAKKLSAAQVIDHSPYGKRIRIKQEKEDSINGSPKKSSKASKTIDSSTAIKAEKNKTLNGHDDDVDRIKQIFQQC